MESDVFGKYPRLWALKGANPNDVRRWYRFGALSSICTVAPNLWEISKLPDWVLNAVVESWHNNPHLKRGDEQEIKFITVASEDTTNTTRYPSFHFMKLQKPDKKAFTYINEQEMKPELVFNLTKDEISTRRAWGVWFMCMILNAAAVVAPPAEVAIGCGAVASYLSPCLNYMTGKSSIGGRSGGIKSLYSAANTMPDRQNVCSCLKSLASSNSGINLAKAAELPGQCGVTIPYKISPCIDCSKYVLRFCDLIISF
ncbi:hypothetical protein ACS0TY_025861 [Phlomoides rotata]